MSKRTLARRAVRVWLATHDKTQTWLAGRLGMHESLVSATLNGHRVPTPEFVDGVRKITGIDIRHLEQVSL
jgi:hypothetical protein